jgi:hypothetical protein
VIWEAIFLLVILKIPIVYLCCVVYWAIRAEPAPPAEAEPALVAAGLDPRPGWAPRRGGRRLPRGGPHSAPRRGYARRRSARTPA